MKFKLIHPIWTHLPAAAALVISVVYMFTGGTLPDTVPVHFGYNGQPDAYGSPWLVMGLTIGLSLFFMGISIFLDELWAQQEKKKAFNWLSLMDELSVGAMVGINLSYLAFLHNHQALYQFRWPYLLVVGGGAIILGVLLELLRPYRPHAVDLEAKDSQSLKTEIARRLQGNSPFVYWDYQNPLYVSVLTVILPMVFILNAVLVLFELPWMSLLFFAIALSSTILHGGQRVIVTRNEVTIRWGLLGLKVLRLATAEISGVEKHEFAPIRDFGGYGIRFNSEMKAFFLRGNQGVKLTTTGGRKYLIGSNSVDRLEAVIEAVTGR